MAANAKTAKSGKQKMTFKEYRQKLNEAYNSGYKDGWSAHERIPNVRGGRTAAKTGYSNGLKNHRKADKYRNKAK